MEGWGEFFINSLVCVRIESHHLFQEWMTFIPDSIRDLDNLKTMFGTLKNIFDSNDREVKKLLPIIDEINALEPKIKKLKDSDFPKKTEELKKRLKEGENIFLILPEAFALAREAAHRSVG